jgi:phage tail sheath protein FI
MTRYDIHWGWLIVTVGIALARPAEFVFLRIAQ